ncbi:phosphatidylethanolamine N-methyltransferase-like isoform X1 [Dreissena polymorpha]|uniref:Phosphatidylethanolamine N-methyltransferase n=2 Tax=Dreissena polymorpha TaxID=45954 RepID=A0A9D4RJP6_DREPO|nr:phosphatidylethanolamine N-methyltransferase-like isoform X1 [Dreissena polymorpha]KAH3870103.1 hypothetical protein DPMN_033284 [Dreissena polymorpha]
MRGRSFSDCCSGYIDFSKARVPDMDINWSDVNLWVSLATITFNPLFWNVVARWEYRSKALSNLFRNQRLACVLLGITIFLLGLFRDLRFKAALDSQPRWYALHENWILWSGYSCMAVGAVFVLISYYRLGFFGTFLGDYFGILMDEKVTSFPFSVLENPMYWGSFLNFVGGALVKASQAGLVLSIWVAVCYKVAIQFEGPFTAKIYEDRDRKMRFNKMA